MSFNKDTNVHICVNRVEQIEQVKKRLNTIRLNKSVFDLILEWYGIPGIGKTTLAQNAIIKLCQGMQVPYVCIDFDPEMNKNASAYSDDPALLIEDIFKGIGKHKPTALLDALESYQGKSKITYEERKIKVIDEFLNYVKELLKNGPITFVFDTTEKIDSELAVWLEKNIISPLCLTGKCIVIWTGRFPQRWRQFEIRRRVVSNRLEPLHPDATKEQVGPSEVDIYRYTFGHPMGNRCLFEAVINFKQEERTDEKILINVVDKVIDEYVMNDLPTDLNAACRVLSTVRQFDVAMLRRILSRFVDYYKHTEVFLVVIGELTETSLVEWDKVRKGYALDETMRHILALHLKLNQPERYVELNEAASHIYEEWIERVRENRSIYVLERLFHEANISEIKNDTPSEIAAKLQKELGRYLQNYYQDDDPEFAQSAVSRLYEELCKDDELEKITGAEGFSLLIETVDKHRSSLGKKSN